MSIDDLFDLALFATVLTMLAAMCLGFSVWWAAVPAFCLVVALAAFLLFGG